MHVEIDHAVGYEPIEHYAPWETVDHLSSACAVSYSADGKYVSVGRSDGCVSVYEWSQVPVLALTLNLSTELGGISYAKECVCSCMAWNSGLSNAYVAAAFAIADRATSIVCVWDLHHRTLVHTACVRGGVFTDIAFLHGRCDAIAALRPQPAEDGGSPLLIIDFASHRVLFGSQLESHEEMAASGRDAVVSYLNDMYRSAADVVSNQPSSLAQEKSIPVRRWATMLLTSPTSSSADEDDITNNSNRDSEANTIHYVCFGAMGGVELRTVILGPSLNVVQTSDCVVAEGSAVEDVTTARCCSWGHLSMSPHANYILIALGYQQDVNNFVLQDLCIKLFDMSTQCVVGTDIDIAAAGIAPASVVGIQFNDYQSPLITSDRDGDMAITVVQDVGDKNSANGVKVVMLREVIDSSTNTRAFTVAASSVAHEIASNAFVLSTISKRRFPFVAICPTRPIVVAVDVRLLKRGPSTSYAGGLELLPASNARYVLSGDLWMCRGGIVDSAFASAMYPPGYRVVSEITKCREREDEFDILPSAPAPEPQKGTGQHGSSSRRRSSGGGSKRSYEEMVVESESADAEPQLKPNARLSSRLVLDATGGYVVAPQNSGKASIFDLLNNIEQSTTIKQAPLPMKTSDFASLPAEFTVVVRPTLTQSNTTLSTKYFPIKNGFDIDFVPLTKQAAKAQAQGGSRVGGGADAIMPTMAITRRADCIGGPSMPSLAQSSSVVDAMQSASRSAAASTAYETLQRAVSKTQVFADAIMTAHKDAGRLAQYLAESERVRLESLRGKRRARKSKAGTTPATSSSSASSSAPSSALVELTDIQELPATAVIAMSEPMAPGGTASGLSTAAPLSMTPGGGMDVAEVPPNADETSHIKAEDNSSAAAVKSAMLVAQESPVSH